MAELRLKLFIAGDSPRGVEASRQLSRICAEQLGGGCDVETIDVIANPEAADEYRILTTPTVVRESPLPRRRVTGDLRDAAAVLAALALASHPTSP